MGERCEVVLEKDIYHPGETIHGRVVCHFDSEDKVRGVRVRFKGRAKVHWREEHYNRYRSEEVYFEKEWNLLSGETTFAPGMYTYPFSYALPPEIPSSMHELHGDIKYTVSATLDRPWGIDDCCKVIFSVYSSHDFSIVDSFKKSTILSQEDIPFSLFTESGPIRISVNLPRNSYFLSEVIEFSAKVRNDSTVKVKEVCFKITQGFEFYASKHRKVVESYKGPEFLVENSSMEPGSEKNWNLELKVPTDMFVGKLSRCNIIKVFWELQGEVCLPFPHNNFTLNVPLILGDAPTT